MSGIGVEKEAVIGGISFCFVVVLCPSYRNVFAADGFRYSPNGSVCWMFATAGISVGRFSRMGT